MKSYDNVEKLLKGNLKRKVKLTLATVVAFLITGTLGFAKDIIIEKDEVRTSKIEIKNNEEIELLKNNGIVSVIANGGYNANGIFNNTGIIGRIENNGIIEVVNTTGKATGIFTNQKVEMIENNGRISVKSSGEAIGIDNFTESSIIKTIINNGELVINSDSSSKGILNNSTGKINNITNNGRLLVKGKEDSFGISSNSGNIDLINNNGLIEAVSTTKSSSQIAGGIIIVNPIEKVEINNKGTILVQSTYGARGIEAMSGTINKITNDGRLVVNSLKNSEGGIVSTFQGEINLIENNGIISSYSPEKGYGITNGWKIGEINNTGIVYGKTNAIYRRDYTKDIDKSYNYGILASSGNKIVDGVTLAENGGKNKVLNYGLAFKVGNNNYIIDSTTKAEHENVMINDVEYTILNAGAGSTNVTSTNSFAKTNYDKHILNGITDTLKVSSETSVSNSVVNGYTSAVVFDEGGGTLNLSNTIINGGIDIAYNEDGSIKSQSATIKGGAGADNVNISSGTIVNGNIDLGAGEDRLYISSDSNINGDIKGGAGIDILTFENKKILARSENIEFENIDVINNISEFENGKINSKVNVTLFENIKLDGMKSLEISDGGKLTLKLNPTDKVGGDGEDKNNIKAGALHDSGITISGEGTLNIASAGLTEDDKITFGDSRIEEDTKVEMDSVILGGEVDDNGDLVVSKETNIKLSDDVARHDKLNNIYTQILDDNLKDINTIITTAEPDNKDKQVEMLSSYLNGVYAENPYSLSSEFSRKSAELMRNSILANREKAIKNEQITYGGLTHQDGRLDGSYYGPDLNGITRYSGDIDVDTNLFGAYGAIEYGYFDKTSLGFVVGGSRGDSKVGSSKVDGNTIYTGLYSKTDLPYNLRLTVGTGVQHGSYDAERNYLSDNHKGNYSDTAFDIYANIKYTQMLQENLFLDYGFGMSYTYVDQDSVSEENKNLAIDVDSKTFDYTDAKLDLGLRKVIGNNFGKHNLKLGASYSYMLDGADEENLRGSFKGTNSFDILVAEKEKDTFGVSLGYELERENGFMLNVNAGYNFSNSDNNEMVVGVQIGKKL